MEVSLNYFKSILKTLPIGYYTGRQIRTEISTVAETSYYNLLDDEITISFKGMESMFEKMKDIEDLETSIRSVLYHEVSHALITPKDLVDTKSSFNQYLYNVFEDERIETVFKDFYYGIDFKKNIVLMNNYTGEPPKNAMEAFYHTVRFRAGKEEHIELVNDIINRYYEMNTQASWSTISSYKEAIHDLFNKIAKDYYEENEPQKLKDFDKNYDKKDQHGKEESAGKCAQNEMQKDSEGSMTSDTITTIILVDDDYDESGHNHNPNKQGGGNTLIVKPGDSTPGKGDSNMPSQTSNKDPKEKDKKQKELEDLLSKIDKNCRIIDQRKKERTKQKLLEDIVNKYIDTGLTETIGQIFAGFTKRHSQNASANRGYSGVLNYRDVGRKDWRIFTHKSDFGPINGYDKLHLNLFIDTSGSFYDNVDKVNTILKSLDDLEKRFPFFEYDLVSCQVGEQLHNKRQRYIHANGGNDLDDEIFPIFRNLQKPRWFNTNVILFDGDAFTDARGRNHQKNFAAFNSTNCAIISDSSNRSYIETYAPQAYKIFVSGRSYYGSGGSYSQLLFDNIIQVLQKALN